MMNERTIDVELERAVLRSRGVGTVQLGSEREREAALFLTVVITAGGAKIAKRAASIALKK